MAINFNKADFVLSSVKASTFIRDGKPQVTFAGRSNVGKSSVINRLLNRKNFARVGATPGKTSQINYFLIDGKIYFTDLPGYGYAKVGKAERERWAGLIDGYYHQERSFNLVVSLVDIRHDAQKLDVQMLDFLRSEELPFVVALTKADKLSRPKQARARDTLARQFGIDREQLLVTSSETGQGIDDLKRLIAEACL